MKTVNIFGTLILALVLSAARPALAQDAKSTPAKGAPTDAKPTDKVDISDVEQKYWAPKDTDFSVVQNRAYTKEKRFSVSATYGPTLNDQYSDGYNLGLSANYFFTERYGVEVNYINSQLKDNQATRSFADQLGGLQPDHGRMKSSYTVGFNWVPVYAKMSFLNRKIVYFDMAFTPVIGMVNYDQLLSGRSPGKQSAFIYGFDITQYYFFSNHFAFRFDIKSRWYNQEFLTYSGTNIGQPVRDSLTQTLMLLLGVTYYF